MRDLVLKEALHTMAADAALRLRELLASGDEIPYEVREGHAGSALAQYTPQTARYIRERAGVLAELDSFGAACSALESAGLAEPYLEEMGIAPPPDARRRGELAGIVFLARLWRSSTDLTLDDARLAEAVDEILSLADAERGEVEIVVPLRGFQMDAERLPLASVAIIRSDVVDVPAEARTGEGMGMAGWQPPFIAYARLDAEPDDERGDLGARAVDTFKRLVTTLRLFKEGGVELGPHAWIRRGGDRWRRISTGAGRPRPGGYRLSDNELGDLQAFARSLAGESTPFNRALGERSGFAAVLRRALARFEAGLERTAPLDALNDYLLTLRFLLEGGGPASLALPMRVAALCAEPERRAAVKAVVDRALAVERELWSGDPAPLREVPGPVEIAAELEELTRAILADAACGHLGQDLRATADEILLAEGLSVGEGSATQRGETAEWEMGERLEADLELRDTAELEALDPHDAAAEGADSGEVDAGWAGYEAIADEPYLEPADEPADEPAPPVRVPEPEGGIDVSSSRGGRGFVRAQNLIHEVELADGPRAAEGIDAAVEAGSASPRRSEAEAKQAAQRAPEEEPRRPERALRAVADHPPVEQLITESREHQREVSERVSFLFPRPEACEWKVPEVAYDRRRRAGSSEHATRAS